jgi:hypothetical protein
LFDCSGDTFQMLFGWLDLLVKPSPKNDNDICPTTWSHYNMLNLFTRKNFSEKVKTRIVKQTAKCQICGLMTECGEFAHIVASGRNGPRNKHQLVKNGTIEEDYDVNNESNGLYLCANCHTQIDKYPEKYTYHYLINIKSHISAPQQTDQPDITIPQQTDQPDITIPQQTDHPDITIPQQMDQPDITIPQQMDQPDITIPQQMDQPEPSQKPQTHVYSQCGVQFTARQNLYRHRNKNCKTRISTTKYVLKLKNTNDVQHQPNDLQNRLLHQMLEYAEIQEKILSTMDEPVSETVTMVRDQRERINALVRANVHFNQKDVGRM